MFISNNPLKTPLQIDALAKPVGTSISTAFLKSNSLRCVAKTTWNNHIDTNRFPEQYFFMF